VTAEKDEGLKRLGGGRWQTRDERFTIEPQSGTWAVLDADQTDDLGLPLVRGPFKSLGAAKEAIAEARGAELSVSPLKERAKAVTQKAKTTEKQSGAARTAARKPAKAKPVGPEEPRWMRDLEPDERRRANRLIERLTAADARDPEGIVRRDLVGEVPAVAAFAIERAIGELGIDAPIRDVVDLLTDGRDAGLGVRWRLVDDDGRQIQIDTKALDRS
jgi:hypothetical protein